MDWNPGMIELVGEQTGREIMRTPDEVTAIVELKRKGWGAKRIARELGISKNTVKRYLRAGGWQPYGRPSRAKVLDKHLPWVNEQYMKHRGNADVVRQELQRQFRQQVSLRTIERAVAPLRRQLNAAAVATVLVSRLRQAGICRGTLGKRGCSSRENRPGYSCVCSPWGTLDVRL